MVAVAGNSLLNLGRAIAAEIGPYQPFTATSTSGANDLVISTALADSEAPTERYGGYYLYSHSGGPSGQQQRVKRNGFTGATGTLQTATAYANTPPISGTWSLLGTMPWITQDGLTGIRECVNRALRKLWVVDRYPITAVAGQTAFDLGALYWMSKKRVIRLLDPPTATEPARPASRGFEIVADGETWTLNLDSAYPAGDIFSLVVERPANSRLYLSGAWAEQSSPVVGLILDADACLGAWNVVFQCALYEVFIAMRLQAGGARKSYWVDRAQAQRGVVADIKGYEADQESVTLGEGASDAPGSSTWGDKGFWAL